MPFVIESLGFLPSPLAQEEYGKKDKDQQHDNGKGHSRRAPGAYWTSIRLDWSWLARRRG
jgi:hypothetical protein